MTIGQKFRPKMISAPKQPHASTISLWCQWPLRKKKKRKRKYIYILCLSWLTACNLLTWTMVRHRRVSSSVCVCARVIIPVCELQNFSRRCLTATALFFTKWWRYHCTAISVFFMNQQICQTDTCISLDYNFHYQIFFHISF